MPARRKENRRCSGKLCHHVSQFGFDSRVVSAVGIDADGDEILDVFAQKGLRTQIERVPYPTGTVQVTLDAVGCLVMK